jgi:hypothetical protein
VAVAQVLFMAQAVMADFLQLLLMALAQLAVAALAVMLVLVGAAGWGAAVCKAVCSPGLTAQAGVDPLVKALYQEEAQLEEMLGLFLGLALVIQ